MPSQDEQPYKAANPLLYKRIKDGDSSAIDEMIAVNMQLVQERVRSYIKRNEDAVSIEDDLVSEGYLALVDKIQRLGKYTIENVNGYLTRALDRAILSSAISDGAIRVTQQSRFDAAALPGSRAGLAASRRACAKGRPIEVHQAPMLFDRHPTKDYRSSVHLMAELEHYCRTEVDVSIVRHRVDGYTLQEICEQVDRPYSYVHRTLKDVEKKYDEARDQ